MTRNKEAIKKEWRRLKETLLPYLLAAPALLSQATPGGKDRMPQMTAVSISNGVRKTFQVFCTSEDFKWLSLCFSTP